ncbi:hypothetical protein GPECTOR_1g913 [Gonium pectorale]|uniref:BACK domain-containing protein n=1 Tax=Gonium pectorale TaxID=33097 RepID=A0A150H4N3_GONPE|nr:hypothetical protein GPECTOR_1g913 [Gonium pectorale]|eukprot:KXZ57011.1 hypothetical protein GPECTOR_1g913 [Gonium pectorale]
MKRRRKSDSCDGHAAENGFQSGPKFIGEPIRAHRLVLRCGSERFRAYMDRWERKSRRPVRVSAAFNNGAASDLDSPATVLDVPQPEINNNSHEEREENNTRPAEAGTPGEPQPAALAAATTAQLVGNPDPDTADTAASVGDAGDAPCPVTNPGSLPPDAADEVKGDNKQPHAHRDVAAHEESPTVAAVAAVTAAATAPNIGQTASAAGAGAAASMAKIADGLDPAADAAPAADAPVMAAAAAAAPAPASSALADTAPVAAAKSHKRPRPALQPQPEADVVDELGGLPELLVPLGREEELPAARRALRFLYTGDVPHVGFKEILLTRRLGGYMQLDGCAAACDAAYVGKLDAECRGCSAVVLDAYECWQAFPDDPSFAPVLAACTRHLVAHFRDAPAILNTMSDGACPGQAPVGSLIRQFTSLPPPAMEVLFASDDFATDSESSVLLLLAYWLDANPGRIAGVRSRLCRLIRVLHLSPPYLHHVLPSLSWFDATQRQRSALAALATTRKKEELRVLRTSLRAYEVDLGPDLRMEGEEERPPQGSQPACKWLAPPRAQCLATSPRVFRWSVSSEQLARAAREEAREPPAPPGSGGSRRSVKAVLAPRAAACADAAGGGGQEEPPGGVTHVVSHGLLWGVELCVSRHGPAHAMLSCYMPAFGAVAGFVDLSRCPVRLAVEYPSDPERDGRPLRRVLLQGPGLVPLGVRLSIKITSEAAFVRQISAAAAAGVEPDLMEPWQEFVQRDRTLRGEICFEAPEPRRATGSRPAAAARRHRRIAAPMPPMPEDEEDDELVMMVGRGEEDDDSEDGMEEHGHPWEDD